MDLPGIISAIEKILPQFKALSVSQEHPDELRIQVSPQAFRETCLGLHKLLSSSVMMLYALDERKERNVFVIDCVFLSVKESLWVIVSIDVPADNPRFDSLARDIHSASLFEREIWEMFGIEPMGHPDLRRLHLHDEVCPEGNYPLRKDFKGIRPGKLSEYIFNRVEGKGIFEVPVGPVHAGIIGPGHFRFSSAGEPIINLEIRLGFTHRGAEKLFEGKTFAESVRISERVSGDSSFAHSLAFVNAAEKILEITPLRRTLYLRAIFLELERMYNHVNDIGGMATDVGFSFPAALASIIKEAILQLNDNLTGSRYLKGVNEVGGVLTFIGPREKALLRDSLKSIMTDFRELDRILSASVSFMDRVDSAGVLRIKTARDLGVVGLAARASGIAVDLRRSFPGVYREVKFNMSTCDKGDVLARYKVRVLEFEESARLIRELADRVRDRGDIDEIGTVPNAMNSAGRNSGDTTLNSCRMSPGELSVVSPELPKRAGRAGEALGYVEGWRGAVLYRVKTDGSGRITRCKIVDPSFHNWQALSYAVLDNIIPDFPLCNKSFDLSYSGNDL